VLNGTRLGDIAGIHPRQLQRDIAAASRTPERTAVRISPPPHPGSARAVGQRRSGRERRQSCDRRTDFVATEGWDWIPAIRDRNSGIWQRLNWPPAGRCVCSIRRSSLGCRYAHRHGRYHHPGTDRESRRNRGAGSIDARFEGVQLRKQAVLDPGVTEVRMTRANSRNCGSRIRACGGQWLRCAGTVSLALDVSADGVASDSKKLRFGSARSPTSSRFDHAGRLRRVEVDPTGGSERHERLIDVRHEAIKRTANGWAESLTAEGENSPRCMTSPAQRCRPICDPCQRRADCRPRGSWGTDDLLKASRVRTWSRISGCIRKRISTSSQLARQNTEEVFYIWRMNTACWC